MAEYDPQEKELVNTLDRKLIPFLAVLLMCLLVVRLFDQDRSNMLHTRITSPATRAGIEQDMHLDDTQFMWALAAFAVGSIAFVLPATLTFRKIGPSALFSISLFSWGLITACTAGVDSAAGFIASRFFLGVSQAGYCNITRFLPCIWLYIVYFYTKEETATRFAAVLCIAMTLESLSGIVYFQLESIEGNMSLKGWQCVFMLEGIVGMIMAVITWFYLPNYPETCYFLNKADQVLAVARGNDGYEQETSLVATGLRKVTKSPTFKFDYNQLTDAVKELRNWTLALAYLCVTITLDFLVVLTPEVSITSFDISPRAMHNSTQSQLEVLIHDYSDGTLPIILISVFPYMLAIGTAYMLSKHSDLSSERSVHASMMLFVAAGGFTFMSLLSPQVEGGGPSRYFVGLLPAVIGVMTATPALLAYGMDKAIDDTYRATTMAIIIGPGHAFSLLLAGNPAIFSGGAPTYPLACFLCAILTGFGGCALLLLRWYQSREGDNDWARAPGLRRLMNDQDEAKAWDIELTNVDFLKTNMDAQDSDWE